MALTSAKKSPSKTTSSSTAKKSTTTTKKSTASTKAKTTPSKSSASSKSTPSKASASTKKFSTTSVKSSASSRIPSFSTSRKPSASNDSSMLLELFTDGIKDIYWAEKALIKTLPKMKKAATSPELQAAFQDHLEVTTTQATRLEQVFQLLGTPAKAKKCEAMDGLIKEGESIIEDTEKGTATRDVGLILAAQKVEHYEIATYGGLAQLARTLGKNDIAQILETTLAEEKETDTLLTGIAENDVNYDALDESK